MTELVRWDLHNLASVTNNRYESAYIRPEIRYDDDNYHIALRGESLEQLKAEFTTPGRLYYSLYQVDSDGIPMHVEDSDCAGDAIKILENDVGKQHIKRIVMGPLQER